MYGHCLDRKVIEILRGEMRNIVKAISRQTSRETPITKGRNLVGFVWHKL